MKTQVMMKWEDFLEDRKIFEINNYLATHEVPIIFDSHSWNLKENLQYGTLLRVEREYATLDIIDTVDESAKNFCNNISSIVYIEVNPEYENGKLIMCPAYVYPKSKNKDISKKPVKPISVLRYFNEMVR